MHARLENGTETRIYRSEIEKKNRIDAMETDEKTKVVFTYIRCVAHCFDFENFRCTPLQPQLVSPEHEKHAAA